MILYSQSGLLTFSGKTYQAYSGHGIGKNNHTCEKMQNIGPIPCGDWEVLRWDDWHGDKGPQVAVLAPTGFDPYGRSAFLIHGDSVSHPGDASHGCIITARDVRNRLRDSGERRLQVIAGSAAVSGPLLIA